MGRENNYGWVKARNTTTTISTQINNMTISAMGPQMTVAVE